MKRVVLIGNSHLGAFKTAIDAEQTIVDDLKVDYFGAPGNWAFDLCLENGRLVTTSERLKGLVAKTPGSLKEIELDAYDAIVLVGLFIRFMYAARLYLRHRLPGHADGRQCLISPAAFDAAYSEYMRSSAAYKVAALIRSHSSMPILLVPEPYPSSEIKGDPEWEGLWESDLLPHMRDTFFEHLRSSFEDLDVDLIEQSPKTMDGPVFTHPRFSARGVNLRKELPADERLHMNRRYGQIMMAVVRRALLRKWRVRSRGRAVTKVS